MYSHWTGWDLYLRIIQGLEIYLCSNLIATLACLKMYYLPHVRLTSTLQILFFTTIREPVSVARR